MCSQYSFSVVSVPYSVDGSMNSIMSATTISSGFPIPSSPSRFGRRARVLCDYEAKDPNELSLMADEIINVRDPGDGNTDYYLGESGMRKGRVPRAFLEVMNE